MIFILDHPKPGFQGVVCGVDFCNGKGSTSSPYQAIDCIKAKCTLSDAEARAEIRVLAQKLARARRKGDEARAVQDAFERTPAYTAKALERMEEKKRNDPKWEQERLLERQLRRHYGLRTKKIK